MKEHKVIENVERNGEYLISGVRKIAAENPIIGDVRGKTCIILDDMVDTAGSLCGAAKALVEIGGAKEVYACASHGVLSGPAHERISQSYIKELLLADTIPAKEADPKIRYISTATMLSEAIRRIHDDVSISSLFD